MRPHASTARPRSPIHRDTGERVEEGNALGNIAHARPDRGASTRRAQRSARRWRSPAKSAIRPQEGVAPRSVWRPRAERGRLDAGARPAFDRALGAPSRAVRQPPLRGRASAGRPRSPTSLREPRVVRERRRDASLCAEGRGAAARACGEKLDSRVGCSCVRGRARARRAGDAARFGRRDRRSTSCAAAPRCNPLRRSRVRELARATSTAAARGDGEAAPRRLLLDHVGARRQREAERSRRDRARWPRTASNCSSDRWPKLSTISSAASVLALESRRAPTGTRRPWPSASPRPTRGRPSPAALARSKSFSSEPPASSAAGVAPSAWPILRELTWFRSAS